MSCPLRDLLLLFNSTPLRVLLLVIKSCVNPYLIQNIINSVKETPQSANPVRAVNSDRQLMMTQIFKSYPLEGNLLSMELQI